MTTDLTIFLTDAKINLLRDYFRISGNHLDEQLRAIVAKQYEPEVYSEVGGSLFYNERDLEFRIVTSSVTEEAERALNDLESGDPSHIDVLIAYARRIATNSHESGLYADLFHLMQALNSLKTSTVFDLEGSKDVVNMYRTSLLNGIYMLDRQRLGINDNGFIGIFHVHEDGTPPSLTDYYTFMFNRFPMIVISATSPKSQIDVYLITQREDEKIYTVHSTIQT